MYEYTLIITTILSYLIIDIFIHLIFFLTTIVDNQWRFVNLIKRIYSRYFKSQSIDQIMNEEKSRSNAIQTETCKFLIINRQCSSSSNIILESEIILTRTIRSFGLFFCTILFITNWFRLMIYFLPYVYRTDLQSSTSLCLFQSYFLHVLTLFHLNLTIFIRLFWHYCFLFQNHWQNLTYRRLICLLVCLFLFECFLTWPVNSHKWATFTFDSNINLCFVNYKFRYSYTFFVLSLTCIIPYWFLIVSHYTQMKSIDKRMTNSSINHDKINLINRKQRFQCSSYLILIWSLFNIILLICIHTPFDNYPLIKLIVYYLQLFVLLLDPIFYTFIFRSLSIITLLRPTNHSFL